MLKPPRGGITVRLQKPALRALVALLCLLTAILTATPGHTATVSEQFSQVYELPTGGTVSLENTNGSIEIAVWDRSEVSVEAKKTIKTRHRDSADEALKALRIEVKEEAGRLEIETHYPRRSGGVWSWLWGQESSARVSYKLTVPRDCSLEIETVNGNVDGTGPRGTLRVRTTNGNVEIEDAEGPADIRTTNGNIEAELLRVEAGSDLLFATTNGGIELYLPADIRSSVSASTTNGSIETDFPVAVRGRLRRNRLEGEINGGGGQLRMQTTNGSIQIRKL
jgi:DUF4097 and DUF4098 domain-containing protein YvlB